jgi:hypothetical protein
MYHQSSGRPEMELFLNAFGNSSSTIKSDSTISGNNLQRLDANLTKAYRFKSCDSETTPTFSFMPIGNRLDIAEKVTKVRF